MKNVIIVIGQSCSGKTTYVKNNFLNEASEFKFIDKPFKITLMKKNNDQWILPGHYKGEKRCEGTDELSMGILPKLIEYIKNEKENFDILCVEGDRINNKRFFNFIKTLNVSVSLIYLKCSLEESIKRRIKNNSDPSETFVKTTITKSQNMFLYGHCLGFKTQCVVS